MSTHAHNTTPKRPHPSRQRANTSVPPSVSFMGTRAKGAPAPPAPSLDSSSQTPTMQELIASLAPPNVPSLHHARTLAQVLSDGSTPAPAPHTLAPLLAALLDPTTSPPQLQCAGADIVSAYPCSDKLSELDRRSWVALVVAQQVTWNAEVALSRLTALKALTAGGTTILGFEHQLAQYLLDAVRESLSGGSEPDRQQYAEETAALLRTTLARNRGLFTDDVIQAILDGLAGLVDALLDVQPTTPPVVFSASTSKSASISRPAPPSRATSFHRRSSSSLTTLPTPAELLHPHHQVQPQSSATTATLIYLRFLPSFPPLRSRVVLERTLRTLCRAFGAHLASSGASARLPLITTRAAVLAPSTADEVPRAIEQVLLRLVQASVSSSVVRGLARLLHPTTSSSTDATQTDPNSRPTCPLTSLGALRALRIPLTHTSRRRLTQARIEAATAASYSMTGAPTDMDETAFDELAKEEGWAGVGSEGWNIRVALGGLSDAIRSWVDRKGDQGQGKWALFQEAADVLVDVGAEADFWAEMHGGGAGWEEDARRLYGGVLSALVGCLSEISVTLEQATNYPLILPLHASDPALPLQPGSGSQIALLHTLTSLLRRRVDQRPALEPSMAEILLTPGCAPYISDSLFENLVAHLDAEGAFWNSTPGWLDSFRTLFGAIVPATAGGGRAAAQSRANPVSSQRRGLAIVRVIRSTHWFLRDREQLEDRRKLMKLVTDYWAGSVASHTVRSASQHEHDSIKEGIELLREEIACEAVVVLESQKEEEKEEEENAKEDEENSAKDTEAVEASHAASITETVDTAVEEPAAAELAVSPSPAEDNAAQGETSTEQPTSPTPTTPTPASRPRPLPKLRPPAHQNPALLPPLAEHIENILLNAAISCDGSCLNAPPSQPLTGSWDMPSQPSSPPAGGFTASGAFSPTLVSTPVLTSPPRGHGSDGSREKEKEKDRGESAGLSKFVGNIFRPFASTPARETSSSLSSLSSTLATPLASDPTTPILGGAGTILSPGLEDAKKYDCKGVLATTALVNLFVELAFGGGGLGARPHHSYCVRLYSRLLNLLKKDVPVGLSTSPTTETSANSPAPSSRPLCPKARLVVLSFFMRLRADRDHRIWMLDDEEVERETRGLAGVVRRLAGAITTPSAEQVPPTPAPVHGHHPAQLHTHVPLPPRGRQTSADRERASRSRSRPPPPQTPHLSMQSGYGQGREEALWSVPEKAVFKLPGAALPHDGIQTHIVTSSTSTTATTPAAQQPAAPSLSEPVVLQINDYLSSLVTILSSDTDHNIVSYVLCHLPAQLANKHFFCGPKTRPEIGKLLDVLCEMVTNDGFSRIVPHQGGSGAGLGFAGIGGAASGNVGGDQLRTWDVNAVAYHTLMVLISYQSSFPKRSSHDRLVSTFIKGLVPHSPTAKPTLDALTLCAFELQQSMIRHLSDIVARLSQIMSNTPVAVHILDFLGFVATRPILFASFTEEQHKMVFGVVLQYLTVHERGGAEAGGGASWALRQHVLAYTYYVLYALVLALPVRERKLYVPYITRQLLAANDGRAQLDERAEVAFDWLIRYTYSSADPRPADSFLRSLVMPEETDGYTKNPGQTWVFETSVLTVRTSAKPGWVELDTRRPSGRTVMLARLENVPLAGLGEHEPDLVTEGAQMVMRRDPEWMEPALFPGFEDEVATEPSSTEEPPPNAEHVEPLDIDVARLIHQPSLAQVAARPDSTTGYIWSKSAPSQRRKEVVVDPGFPILQISKYPDGAASTALSATGYDRLASVLSVIDRMPVIETHKIGVLYVAPGQTDEISILSNMHGSPAYSRFMSGLARLIRIKDQRDVYTGGLEPRDGEYAYAWWDDIGQILYHTATLVPNDDVEDSSRYFKKRNLGNSHVKIIWNDSGVPYAFHTLKTQFQFVNIVIEPHSRGTVAAFSNNQHENEYFRVTIQRAEGMPRFDPVGEYKIVRAESLPDYIRQLGLLSDYWSRVWDETQKGTVDSEIVTNWRSRLQRIKRLNGELQRWRGELHQEGKIRPRPEGEEARRDFTLFAGDGLPEGGRT